MSNGIVTGFATLFWWLIVGVFLYPMLGSIFLSWDARHRYESTSGQVTESMLKEISGAESTTYRPVVAYKYSVNNIEYQGHRIFWTPGAESWSWDVAERMLAPYPVAAYVTVYYDPDKPQLAVLETDVLKYRALQLFALFPFVVMGIALLAMCFRQQRRDTGRRCPNKKPSMWLCRVLPTWFVAHVLSIFALAATRAYLPERAWFVWIAVVVVAAATLVAALPIDRFTISLRRRRTT